MRASRQRLGIFALAGAFVHVLGYGTSALAGVPLITFTPLTPTTITLPVNGSATVAYQVTNQSVRTLTYELRPTPGVTVAGGAGNCTDPFTLAPQQSCRLELLLTGSAIPHSFQGGPMVCVNGNPMQCYQPSVADQLDVTLGPALLASISVNPVAVDLAVGEVATITVANAASSPVAAQGLMVDAPDGSSIMVNLGACADPLQPATSCAFELGGATAETGTIVVVSGVNTTLASVAVTLFDDRLFANGFDG